ncbi:MAG: hypothetical protein ACE37J_11440 [Pikeienuella sp.]|uniref:hypothetical protein n=1 Tax=Pikeienuella sp. TaxID=2831957 RepID=UPI003919433C
MTKRSDTQLVILSNAAARSDLNGLPLPRSLRGGAATKVVGALPSRGFAAERICAALRRCYLPSSKMSHIRHAQHN